MTETIDGDSLAAYWMAQADREAERNARVTAENDKLRELVCELGARCDQLTKRCDDLWDEKVSLETQIGIMNREKARKESRP